MLIVSAIFEQCLHLTGLFAVRGKTKNNVKGVEDVKNINHSDII